MLGAICAFWGYPEVPALEGLVDRELTTGHEHPKGLLADKQHPLPG